MKQLLFILLSLVTTFPYAQTTSTAKTGKWSDPAVWVGGKIPAIGSNITVNSGHTLTLDISYTPIF